MKTLLTILTTIVITANSYSQLGSKLDLTEFAPIVSYKYTPGFLRGQDTTEVHTLSVGISFAEGEIESTSNWGILSLSGNWKYIAAPFISMDYNMLIDSPKYELYKANDGASPLVLNIGITAGYGGYFLIFPIGINGTAGFSTDFKDMYLKYGLAYDVAGISLGISGLINMTHNNDSFYKTKKGIELRWIINWD